MGAKATSCTPGVRGAPPSRGLEANPSCAVPVASGALDFDVSDEFDDLASDLGHEEGSLRPRSWLLTGGVAACHDRQYESEARSGLPHSSEESGASSSSSAHVGGKAVESPSSGRSEDSAHIQKTFSLPPGQMARSSKRRSSWDKIKGLASLAFKQHGAAGNPLSTESLAIEILELTLAMCMATPAEFSKLIQVAEAEDCAALHRLKRLAECVGLMGKPLPQSAKGPPRSPADLARAFLKSGGRGAEKQRPAGNPFRKPHPLASKNRGMQMRAVQTLDTIDSGEPGSSSSRSVFESRSKGTVIGGAGEGDRPHGRSTSPTNNEQPRGEPPRGRLMRSQSNFSSHSQAGTDISDSSFMDFNRRQDSFRIPHAQPAAQDLPCKSTAEITPSSFLKFLVDLTAPDASLAPVACVRRGCPERDGPVKSAASTRRVVMEIGLPSDAGVPGVAPAQSQTGVRIRMPDEDSVSGVCDSVFSDGAATYHSTCDAMLLGEGGERECVQADVVNLTKTQGGQNQVRIEFRSQCLRTQNEWQRNLLTQQRALLDTFSTKLETAQESLRVVDEICAEEKELLRGFHKIITRQLAQDEWREGIEVIIVERRDRLRHELQELCQILEYPCRVFESVSRAAATLQEEAAAAALPVVKLNMGKSTATLKHEDTKGGFGTRLFFSSSRSDHFSRSNTSRSCLSMRSTRTSSSQHSNGSNSGPPELARVVLLGVDGLQCQLPPEWSQPCFHVALTSEAEEFEEVGRTLFASGEAEIRENLRAQGINDYLLHPLSLESLREVVGESLRRHRAHEYLLTMVVGRGTYGVVYRAKRIRDGEVFALKEINSQRLQKRHSLSTHLEPDLLRQLEWPTVVRLVDTWVAGRENLRYIIMPFLKGGDLSQRMEAAAKGELPKITGKQATEWYTQVLHGLCYLHWRGVLHRDLKPANFLLAEDDRALQIGDLGSAAWLPGNGPHPSRRTYIKAPATTLFYSSPESLLEDVHLPASDMWSVGATFYDALMAQPLIPPQATMEDVMSIALAFNPKESSVGAKEEQVVKSALAALRSRCNGEQKLLAGALKELLHWDPLKRPLAAALLKRGNTLQRLQSVLVETGALQPEMVEEHFEELEMVMAEYEEAEDLEPPDEASTYAGAPIRAGTQPTAA